MITADQLLAHAVGDYVLQTDWMATSKTTRSLATLVHSVTYTLLFLFLTTNLVTLLVIGGTHFVIDRYRLARYLVWVRNVPFPGSKPWAECRDTGFTNGLPPYLSTWLLIIVDNIIHVVINGAAIRYIG
jgi:hypothetical protein